MTRGNCADAQAGAPGFTLLELSVVLVLIGIIIRMGLVTMTASLQASQYNATVSRMDDIEKALLNYAIANSRIPCPSDLTQLPGSATYGMEAGAGSGSAISTATGACTGAGMLPQATFVASSGTVEGGVPTRALQLPDDYMYDGWGRRFRYAADPTMTDSGALPVAVNACVSGSSSSITVDDATGAARTTSGIYALVSHGANGHGAYTSSGVTLNAGSVNADELTNCHCDSSAVSTTYAPTYVEKVPLQDPNNALDNFDDIVTFKEGWQMQALNFPLAAQSKFYGGIMSASASTPIWTTTVMNTTLNVSGGMFSVGGGTYSTGGYSPSLYPEPDPTDIAKMSISYDNQSLAVLTDIQSSSKLNLYKLSGSTYIRVQANVSGLPAGLTWPFPPIWSHNGKYLAITSGGGATYLFKNVGCSLIYLGSPGWSGYWSEVWTADDAYLVALYPNNGWNGWGNILQNNGNDTFSVVAPSDLFQGGSYGNYTAFTLDGNYAASFINASTLQIYTKSGGIFVPTSTVALQQPNSAQPSMVFSPNGQFIAVGSSVYGDPYWLAILTNTGNYTFTQMSGLAQPQSNLYTLPSWSSDSKYLAMGTYGNDGVGVGGINIYTAASPTFTGPVVPPAPSGIYAYGQGWSLELTH